MARYGRHIFICGNERSPDDPRGCCFRKGSGEVRDRFRRELVKRNLTGSVRANAAGCLDACEHGVTLVIYPDGIWYGGVRVEDVEEIIDRSVVHGEVIQRLLLPDRRYRPDVLQYPPLDLPPGV